MLSLWANWLQLNSQLNSPGVSFWLYRTYITDTSLNPVVQLSTSYVKSFEIDNLPNREKTDRKGENLSLPVVKKYSQKKIGFWRNYIEFDIRMIVHTQAISSHSYLKPLWENILMRAHESQWEATLNCPWMGSVWKWGRQRLNEQRMRGMGAKVERV